MDHYEILSVPRNATIEEIKKSYHKLALKCHPDHGGNQKSFEELNLAYTTLSNPVKRLEYDRKNPIIHRRNKKPKRSGRDPNLGNVVHVDLKEVDLWKQMHVDEEGVLTNEDIEKPVEEVPKPQPVPKKEPPKDPNLGNIKDAPPPQYDIWGKKINTKSDWNDIFNRQYQNDKMPNLR